MKKQLTSAKCRLCSRIFGKGQMTTHLKACWERHTVPARGKREARWFHLVIEARYAPDYWMHLQAPADTTFGDLDDLLRAIWLECCDHLSSFEFPVERRWPRHAAPGDFATLFEALVQSTRQPFSEGRRSEAAMMNQPLGHRLQPGTVFSHQYDFGSTTTLQLRVAGEHSTPALKDALKLLARNEPPAIGCSECAQPATQVCLQCVEEGDGGLCDDCASQHTCGEGMLLPLVNSPRTGVCGYCGPSIEP